MPITTVDQDLDALTMRVVADFPVPVRRLWDAYADPRQIERFWGPPEWPATFTRHDMFPGGRSDYYMTSPEGEPSGGYWEFLDVDAPRSFEVRDGFAGPDGEPNPEMPSMRMTFEFEETGDGSRLTTTTYFDSLDQLEQLLAMGMREGMTAAMGQIDDVLQDGTPLDPARGTVSQEIDDRRVRISRVLRGETEQVWRAHHESDLMKRWMLGPDGWRMPVCEIGDEVGQSYRYEWEAEDGSERFGFTGEVLHLESPRREVVTERMIDAGPTETVNEMTLTPLENGTLLSLVITYPDRATREEILGTGMVDGMEDSYARLEREVLQGA
ncbi:SRPBCC family protein [Rothia sp. AR01]|uniref:SRPBCC family protein n=1 Tax=Rothia santali TaxID=2949643 RepID=A0A9X2KGH1_9MICC|nr:SRPBCC family protein [Rothia santali]MCP3424852.1 SRPBCC family protein [Rothia santali]